MRLICVFAGSKLNMFDFSHSGSNIKIDEGSNDVSIIIRYKTKIIFFLNYTGMHINTSRGCQSQRTILYFVYIKLCIFLSCPNSP